MKILTLYKLSHSIVSSITGGLCIIILMFLCESSAFAFGNLPAAKEKNNHIPDIIEINDGLITMNVQDVSVTDVLKEISQKSGIEIHIEKGIEEKISLKLENVPLEDVLERLLENRALVYEPDPETGRYNIVQANVFRRNEGSDEQVKDSGGLHVNVNAEKEGRSVEDSSVGRDAAEEKLFDSKGRPLYRQGELLVKFKDDADPDAVKALHDRLGSTLLKRIERLNLDRVRLRQGLTEKEAIGLYSESDLVENVRRHAVRYPDRIEPNDPFFPEQWNLSKISAPEAWEFTTGRQEVVVAVIDSGVNYLHPDMSANIWVNPDEILNNGIDDDLNGYVDDISGWDMADSDDDPMDANVESHGTHVAGIIGAVGNNQTGITGISWNIRIMPVKVQADESDNFSLADILEALSYAIDNGAHIVNCSFGSPVPDDDEEALFRKMESLGIPAVCSAGNSHYNNDVSPNYPASYKLDNIISVAASDQSDELAYFSNYGANSVHLMAPGVNIKSIGNNTEAYVMEGPNNIPAIGMSYAGMTNGQGVSGKLYACGKGLSAADFPAGVNGYIALIERGETEFKDKVAYAQAAGAAAVVVYNWEEHDGEYINIYKNFPGTLQFPENWVPVVSICRSDGLQLLAKEQSHPNVAVINTPSDYGEMGGTSMSAPHVSGAAGLLMSFRPELNAIGIKGTLLGTVDKLDSVKEKIISGGRLNVRRALRSLLQQGDLDCNGAVGLADAIMGLQFISGYDLSFCADDILEGVDLNNDGKIGMEEILYILDKVSEIE